MLRNFVRPIPGAYQVSVLRQRLKFRGSAEFWEERYASGGTSGPGSYGELAANKAAFLNSFVRERRIRSVIEFGCGDGNQLSLADYPEYVGLDVSRSAIKICKDRFSTDATKSFFLYDGTCFVDVGRRFVADLAISLDVVYHLVEDATYSQYMSQLFDASDRFVIIYATNASIQDDAAHVRHRKFSEWAEQNRRDWNLAYVQEGAAPGDRRADFYVYQRSRPAT